MYRWSRATALGALFLVGVLALPPAVMAQDQGDEGPGTGAEDEPLVAPRYGLGDSTLAMRLGIALPLFLLASDEVETPDGERDNVLPANLSVVGSAAVNWNVYLDESFTIGAELGGGLAIDINDALWYMVPILVRGGYVISLPQMEIPLSVGLGAVVMRLVDNTRVAFALQPGAGFLWRATPDWSFGATVEYWLSWEPPWADANDPHFFGNFVSASATAVYHF
jgi:hypothetical protein